MGVDPAIIFLLQTVTRSLRDLTYMGPEDTHVYKCTIEPGLKISSCKPQYQPLSRCRARALCGAMKRADTFLHRAAYSFLGEVVTQQREKKYVAGSKCVIVDILN